MKDEKISKPGTWRRKVWDRKMHRRAFNFECPICLRKRDPAHSLDRIEMKFLKTDVPNVLGYKNVGYLEDFKTNEKHRWVCGPCRRAFNLNRGLGASAFKHVRKKALPRPLHMTDQAIVLGILDTMCNRLSKYKVGEDGE